MSKQKAGLQSSQMIGERYDDKQMSVVNNQVTVSSGSELNWKPCDEVAGSGS